MPDCWQEKAASTVKTFMLYFYADVPESAGLPIECRRSPRAILDRYRGRHYDYSAPDWITVLSPDKSVQFTQPRGEVAELFTSMASWKENRLEVRSDMPLHCLALSKRPSQPNLSTSMIKWAEDITVCFKVWSKTWSDA
jgi:hypothetical protein